MRLPLCKTEFKRLLSVKARRADHSGGLEAAGVVLGLRRLARDVGLHAHRGAFLVDAQAVQAALQNGRSSAPTLRHACAQAAALALACNWRWRYAYIPSESNPADDPSRGVRSRGVRKTISKHGGIGKKKQASSQSFTSFWRKVDRMLHTSRFGDSVDLSEPPTAGSATCYGNASVSPPSESA
jgi:hypothetical protein